MLILRFLGAKTPLQIACVIKTVNKLVSKIVTTNINKQLNTKEGSDMKYNTVKGAMYL